MSLQLKYCSPNVTIHVKCNQSLKKLTFILMGKCRLNLLKNSHLPWTLFGLSITALHITEQRRIFAHAVLLLMINNSSYYQIYAVTTIIFRRRKLLLPRGWHLHRM